MIILVLLAAGLVVFLLNFFKYSGSIISLLAVLVYVVLLLTGKGMDTLYYLLMAYYSGISFIIGTVLTLIFNNIRTKFRIVIEEVQNY
jgi:hypothetical protein